MAMAAPIFASAPVEHSQQDENQFRAAVSLALQAVPPAIATAITSVPWSGVTSTPTTLAGYGITDAYTKTAADARYDVLGAAAAIALSTRAFAFFCG